MSLITDNFLEAIDIIVDKKISEAAYDKAIVAEIKAVVDKDKGIYQVKYQDSSFTAISVGDVEYRVGHQVYVLIPNNDLTQERIILGKTSGSRRDKYADKVIGNSIMKGFTFSTKADNIDIEGSIEQVLYDYNKPQEAQIITALDQAALAEYVHRASSLLVSASFTSKVAENDLKQGDYGFIIEAQFENKVETFIFNKTQLGVDLFNFSTPTLKSALFNNIDGQQFKRINKITWFVKDMKQGAVITFNDLQIYGCTDAIGLNEVGAKLELKAPSGTVFESLTGNNSQKLMTLPIQARLRNGDKYISDPNIEYSFYVETPWAENSWTPINEGDINNPDRTLSNTDFTSYYQHLKCEAKRGSEVYSEQLLFQNTIIDSGWITIERQDDKSICSLTAKLVNENGKVDENTSLDGLCSWMTVSADGVHTKLDNTNATLSIDLNALDGDVTYVVGVESKDKAVARYSIILAQETVIKDATHYYAKSTKDTEVPQSGWSKNKPTSYAGYYLWDKVVYYYTDGSTSESEPMITGTSVSVALYAYGNIQEPGSDNDITGWSTEPLPVSEQQGQQEVYVTYGFNVNGAYLVGQAWTEPILYARYAADGAISIYRYAYQKVKYETALSKPEKNWNALEPKDIPEVWCQVAVDLNKDYPFVYQCMQEEINKDGKISYGEWSAPFLDRHWGEDYIYGYGRNADASLPEVINGNIQWNNDWSSADLTIDEQHPVVYRITGIIEGNVMQKLDSDAGKSQYWTDPVVYKNYSLNLTLADKEYAVADFDNLERVDEIEKWSDVYPEIEDNKGKYIWTKLTYSNNDIRYEITYIAKDGEPGQKGDDGNPTRDLSLKVDSYVIKKDKEGQLSPTKIIFDALVQNIDYTDELLWKINDFPQVNKDQQLELIVDNDLFAKGDFKVSVEFANANEDLAQFKDEVTILCLEDGVDGESAFKVSCTNPVMLFNDTTQEEIATFSVYYGLTTVPFGTATNDIPMYWTLALSSNDIDDGNFAPINSQSVTITESDNDDDYVFNIKVYSDKGEILYNENFIIQTRIVSSVQDFGLETTAIAVKENKDGTITPDTITITPKPKNIKVDVYTWSDDIESKSETNNGARTFETDKIIAYPFEITCECVYNDKTFSDTVKVIKVKDGDDTFSINLTNGTMTFNIADVDAQESTYVYAWHGGEQLAYGMGNQSSGYTFTVEVDGASVDTETGQIIVTNPQAKKEITGTARFYNNSVEDESKQMTFIIHATLVKDGKSSTIKPYYFGPTAIDSINNIPSNANWEEDDPSGEATEEKPYVYRKDVTVEDGIETNKFIIVAHFRFVKGEKGDTGNTIKTSVMRAYWGTNDVGEDTPELPNKNILGNWTTAYSTVYKYPYVYITECEVVFTYNPEGKQIGNEEYKTWSDAALYKVNGSDANVNLVNTFNALTQNGAQQGIYYIDDQGQPIKGALTENSKVKDLFINASMIKTGYLDANTLLAGEIRVGDKFYVKFDKDINGKEQDSSIKLAGFFVNNSQIYSNTRIGQTAWDSTENGICIDSNKGIRLGKGNAFEVTAEGALTAIKASITGEINATSGRFGSETSGVKIDSNGIYKSGIFQLGDNSSIGGLNITTNGLEYQSNGSSVIIKTYDEGNQSSTIISDTAEFNTAIFGDRTSSASKWRFTRTSDGNAFYLEHDDGLQLSGEGLYHSDGAAGQRYIKWIDLLAIATGGAATTIDKVAGLRQELDNRYTKSEILTINENGIKSGVLANYSTTTEMNTAIENAVKTVDLTEYAKTTEVTTMIEAAIGQVLNTPV